MRRSTQSACPICGQPPAGEFKPFCSPRCKDEDLRRWLVGAYRIPAATGLVPEDEDAGPEEDR